MKNPDFLDLDIDFSKPFAFVDGSFNSEKGIYGYGGFISYAGKIETVSGSGKDEELLKMRNVSAEILGAMAVIEKAYSLGIKNISLYYDYAGIECWATGAWKTKNIHTMNYKKTMQKYMKKMNIRFVKVKAHSGDFFNTMVDRFAKNAALVK